MRSYTSYRVGDKYQRQTTVCHRGDSGGKDGAVRLASTAILFNMASKILSQCMPMPIYKENSLQVPFSISGRGCALIRQSFRSKCFIYVEHEYITNKPQANTRVCTDKPEDKPHTLNGEGHILLRNEDTVVEILKG